MIWSQQGLGRRNRPIADAIQREASPYQRVAGKLKPELAPDGKAAATRRAERRDIDLTELPPLAECPAVAG
jgi:hypothetical protein